MPLDTEISSMIYRLADAEAPSTVASGLLLELPVSMGGMGFTGLDCISRAAYIGSLAQTSTTVLKLWGQHIRAPAPVIYTNDFSPHGLQQALNRLLLITPTDSHPTLPTLETISRTCTTGLQRQLTSLIHKHMADTILQRLRPDDIAGPNPDWTPHLAFTSASGNTNAIANAWLRYPERKAAKAKLSNAQWAAAVRTRLHLRCKGSPAAPSKCRLCGTEDVVDGYLLHAFTCSGMRGSRNLRHNRVRDVFKRTLAEVGISGTSIEPQVSKSYEIRADLQPDDKAQASLIRADIRVPHPQDQHSPFMIDPTFCHPFTGRINTTPNAAGIRVAEAESKKRKRYCSFFVGIENRIIPTAFDTFANTSASTLKAIKQLAQMAPDRKATSAASKLFDAISLAVARENANIVLTFQKRSKRGPGQAPAPTG